MISLFKFKCGSMRNEWHFLLSCFPKFNLGQKVLKHALLNFIHCSRVVIFEVLYCPGGGGEKKGTFEL